jgi:hypothetical protein
MIVNFHVVTMAAIVHFGGQFWPEWGRGGDLNPNSNRSATRMTHLWLNRFSIMAGVVSDD